MIMEYESIKVEAYGVTERDAQTAAIAKATKLEAEHNIVEMQVTDVYPLFLRQTCNPRPYAYM